MTKVFSALLVAGLVYGSSTPASAAVIDLTPAGSETCCDDPDWGVKGYRFTVSQAFTAYAGEWLLELPAGTTMAARVRDANGELLLEGAVVTGDGTEQWYRSDFDFDFEEGRTYEVVFFLEAPDEALFRRKIDAYSGYDVPPYLIDLESRSRDGHDDGPTTTYNTWPAFMRLVLDAPDADGDGVADPDDACPRTPGAPDADGDGCTDPQDPNGDDDGGTTTATGSTGENGSGDDDTASTATTAADEDDEDDQGETAGGADTGIGGAPVTGSGGSRACSVGAGGSVPAGLVLLVLLGAGRRRRATAARNSAR